MRRVALAVGGLAAGVLVLSNVIALAATNVVPTTAAADGTFLITANDLKPPECAGVNLTSVRSMAAGGGTNALVLGSPGNDTWVAGGGATCALGGGGNDTLRGGGGQDVLLGGGGDDNLQGQGGPDRLYGEAGNDALNGGGGPDFCDGGADPDTGSSCETSLNIP
jgi:Ca2+-binding RTX toxin-like protein